MNRCNIDDSTPSSFFHLRKGVFCGIEVGAKVESNNFLPHILGEIFYLVDMLNASIINKNVNSSKVFDSLLNEGFGLLRFG